MFSQILAEAHGAGSTWDEYLHLVTDAAHIAFEFTYDIISFLIFSVLWAKWLKPRAEARAIRKHDEEYHTDDNHDQHTK